MASGLHQLAVFEMEHPVGVRRGFGAVGDHDQVLAGLADQVVEQSQDLFACVFVEVAGRLVGQDQ